MTPRGTKTTKKAGATPSEGMFPSVAAPAPVPPTAPTADMPQVQLFTDGACSGNPGPGGWAYILKHPASGKSRKHSGAEPDTTNNKMELTAVIEGLRALTRPSIVELYSDSEYVLNGLREWVTGWKKRGWKTAAKQPVKNVELWQQLDELRAAHQMSYHWVRGHAGHPENEECDVMAVGAIEAMLGRRVRQPGS